MRILIGYDEDRYSAIDTEDEGLGMYYGCSPDEAIGALVRHAYLTRDRVVIDDISSEENL